MVACGKSNYLKVGEIATVTAKDGLYMRTDASAQSKKVGLVPFGQDFKVIAEGATESLYSIKSRWYKVSYRGKTGWLWGGLATQKDIKAVGDANSGKSTRKIVICADGIGDCLNDMNECGRTEFYSDGSFHEPMAGCGEAGHRKGTWREKGDVIEVDYTAYPSCYDSCGDISPDRYTEKHKYSGHRVYELLPNNKATYTDLAKGHRERSDGQLNVKRL